MGALATRLPSSVRRALTLETRAPRRARPRCPTSEPKSILPVGGHAIRRPLAAPVSRQWHLVRDRRDVLALMTSTLDLHDVAATCLQRATEPVQAQLELWRARRSNIEFLSNWECVFHRRVLSRAIGARSLRGATPRLRPVSQKIVPEKLSGTCRDCHKSVAFQRLSRRGRRAPIAEGAKCDGVSTPSHLPSVAGDAFRTYVVDPAVLQPCMPSPYSPRPSIDARARRGRAHGQTTSKSRGRMSE
jgi:hypothetical protein